MPGSSIRMSVTSTSFSFSSPPGYDPQDDLEQYALGLDIDDRDTSIRGLSQFKGGILQAMKQMVMDTQRLVITQFPLHIGKGTLLSSAQHENAT